MTIQEIVIKLLGIMLIVVGVLVATGFRGDNLIINTCLWLPFWIVIWTFLDWRTWTSENAPKEKQE